MAPDTHVEQLGVEQQCVGSLRVVVTLKVKVTQLVQVADIHFLALDRLVEVLTAEHIHAINRTMSNQSQPSNSNFKEQIEDSLFWCSLQLIYNNCYTFYYFLFIFIFYNC